MANRNHQFATGEYYHIYTRGNSKQDVFLDQQDYIIFQQLLYLMNMEKRTTLREVGQNPYSYSRDTRLVSVGVYCIMPNHVHILVKQTTEKGVSKFMQKVLTGYVMYFNKKYKRTGGLFEGTFKSKHAGEDSYLKHLYAYIHLNPLKLINPEWKNKIAQKASVDYASIFNYDFSSMSDYLGSQREQGGILNKEDFPHYFTSAKDFQSHVGSYFIIDR